MLSGPSFIGKHSKIILTTCFKQFFLENPKSRIFDFIQKMLKMKYKVKFDSIFWKRTQNNWVRMILRLLPSKNLKKETHRSDNFLKGFQMVYILVGNQFNITVKVMILSRYRTVIVALPSRYRRPRPPLPTFTDRSPPLTNVIDRYWPLPNLTVTCVTSVTSVTLIFL